MKKTTAACSTCIHKEVCKFKDDFLSTERALETRELMLLIEDERFDVDLKCNLHKPDVSYRTKN